MKKKGYWIMIVLFLALCLIPLVLYPVKGREAAESSENVTALPSLFKPDGSFNPKFLSEAGDYFTGNFALRNELVTADSALRAGIFQTSTQKNVVIGKDGFLFYGSTMDDYLGRETLSDLQLSQIAGNLALMQQTLEEDGKTFVFTIAPNKNSLYPQYMPGNYRTNDQGKNITRLIPKLEAAGVHFVNLHRFFGESDQVFYHKTDSHWTNEAAARVNGLLMEAAGREGTDYSGIDAETRSDMTGDLFRMLYPAAQGSEPETWYQKERDYTYVEEIDSTYDPEIMTENPKKDGSLVMFRDSFGNSLLPFTADEFGAGYFSRELPYRVYEAYDREADTVMAELVERNLYYLQTLAPMLPAHDCTDVELPDSVDASLRGTAAVEDEPAGERVLKKISGKLESGTIRENTVTYVSLYDPEQEFGYIFQTYQTSEEKKSTDETAMRDTRETPQTDGFAVYIDPGEMADGNYQVSVLTERDGTLSRSEDLAACRIGEAEQEEATVRGEEK